MSIKAVLDIHNKYLKVYRKKRFAPGQMIALNSGEIVRIEEIQAEKARLIVSSPKYHQDNQLIEKSKRKISLRAVEQCLSPSVKESIGRAQHDYEQAKAEHLAMKSQTCPTPCAKCGHVYCYSYHYANRSDLGGWEVICCSATCSCFNCENARKENKKHFQYTCCKCSLDPYCECPTRRGW
jgi:hypothetical protein